MKIYFLIITEAIAASLFVTITNLLSCAHAVPVTYEITKGNKECLYDTLEVKEYVTMSVFLSVGPQLRARLSIQGPIAPSVVNSGVGLQRAIDQANRNTQGFVLQKSFDVDMEQFADMDLIDDDFQDDFIDDDAALRDYYYGLDDDDEYQFMEDDQMSDEERKEVRKAKAERDALSVEDRETMKVERRKVAQREREEMMKERKAMIEEREVRMKEREDKMKLKVQKETREEVGESFQKTFSIDEPGWYRVCVGAVWNEISAEIEMRKSSELGQPNTKTGHLQSYERRTMIQEEKRLFHKKHLEGSKNTQAEENRIEEKDLQATRDQLQRLNRLLNEIREKQHNERHRLSLHAATNEHSHSRMVLSSLFETLFYIVVSGFQVWTIRKWFSGAPILGF